MEAFIKTKRSVVPFKLSVYFNLKPIESQQDLNKSWGQTFSGEMELIIQLEGGIGVIP